MKIKLFLSAVICIMMAACGGPGNLDAESEELKTEILAADSLAAELEKEAKELEESMEKVDDLINDL